MTLLELIAQCAATMEDAGLAFGHGTTNAFDEAAWLVLWRLGLPLDTALDTPLDDTTDVTTDVIPNAMPAAPLTPAQIADCQQLVAQRIATRKPAAYLTQEAWLQGFSFHVDERVIVPRSLIAELLVDGTLAYWLAAAPSRVLDLCTGNGSLAIIAAHVFDTAQVDASDLSSDALAVAAMNVERHGLQERVQLHQADGLQGIDTRYDLIVCNPPYVNAQSMASLPAEYRAEPALALDGNTAGGSDGMDFVRTLLAGAAAHLQDDGVLVLEIGNERDYFEAAFPTLDVIWLPTSAGDDQVLLLTRAALLVIHDHT